MGGRPQNRCQYIMVLIIGALSSAFDRHLHDAAYEYDHHLGTLVLLGNSCKWYASACTILRVWPNLCWYVSVDCTVH